MPSTIEFKNFLNGYIDDDQNYNYTDHHEYQRKLNSLYAYFLESIYSKSGNWKSLLKVVENYFRFDYGPSSQERIGAVSSDHFSIYMDFIKKIEYCYKEFQASNPTNHQNQNSHQPGAPVAAPSRTTSDDRTEKQKFFDTLANCFEKIKSHLYDIKSIQDTAAFKAAVDKLETDIKRAHELYTDDAYIMTKLESCTESIIKQVDSCPSDTEHEENIIRLCSVLRKHRDYHPPHPLSYSYEGIKAKDEYIPVLSQVCDLLVTKYKVLKPCNPETFERLFSSQSSFEPLFFIEDEGNKAILCYTVKQILTVNRWKKLAAFIHSNTSREPLNYVQLKTAGVKFKSTFEHPIIKDLKTLIIRKAANT